MGHAGIRPPPPPLFQQRIRASVDYLFQRKTLSSERRRGDRSSRGPLMPIARGKDEDTLQVCSFSGVKETRTENLAVCISMGHVVCLQRGCPISR